MKKQILFLVMVLFAVTTAFGQTVNPIGCTIGTEGPLFPAMGKKYTYSVNIPNSAQFTGSPTLTYQWFVTKDPAFITTGTISTNRATAVLNTDFTVASGTYDAPTAANATIELTWKTPASPTVPYFLVVNVIGKNGVCDPMNMKVYKIEPMNLFTLDIANVDVLNANAVTASAVNQCYQNIQSVTWTSGLNATYDYGSNTLVWAVAAANWSTSWTPTVKLGAAIIAGEAVTMTWAKTIGGAAGGTFTADAAGTTWTTTDVVTPTAIGGTVDAIGEVIYIRMVLDHTVPTVSQFEGLTDQLITLSIDGVTANNDPDLHWSATLPVVNTDCGKADQFKYDIAAVQTVKQRPDVTSTTLPLTQPFLVPQP